jgi:hypothetical protein
MSNQGCQSATNPRKRTALSAAYHPYISQDYGFSMFRQIPPNIYMQIKLKAICSSE